MFILHDITDTVKIRPKYFSKPQYEAIKSEIDSKYSNRVLIDVGLCICLHDIESVSEAMIECDTGNSCMTVSFRLAVFQPFVGEIIQATIRANTEEGVMLSIDFYHDILVPAHLLHQNASFSIQEQVWNWTFDQEDDGDDDEPATMFYDVGEVVLFKVCELKYSEVDVPFQLVGAMNDSGLGCKRWWE